MPSSFKATGDTHESEAATAATVEGLPAELKEQGIEDNDRKVPEDEKFQAALKQGREDKTGESGKAESAAPAAAVDVGNKGNAPELVATAKEQPPVVSTPRKAVIFFEHDSIEMTPESQKELARLVSAVFKFPGSLVFIQGYTDSLGNEWYNRKLSQTRADIVRDFFAEKGIQPEKIKAIGMGADNPIASNDTADGRRKNRRVEIYVGSAVN